jgi:hypothetical protein
MLGYDEIYNLLCLVIFSLIIFCCVIFNKKTQVYISDIELGSVFRL